MEMQLYAIHVVPFVVIVYLAFLLFMHPPKEVIIATLTGGLVCLLMALYRQWAAFAFAPAPLSYTNFDLRGNCLPANLALLAYATALVRLAAHNWHSPIRLCA